MTWNIARSLCDSWASRFTWAGQSPRLDSGRPVFYWWFSSARRSSSPV